jgi:outer membrane protein assembly factor BamB
MVWATRMDYEKEIVSTDLTQHYKDWLLVGGDLGFPPTIMAFNKDTGAKDWEYIHEGAVHTDINVSYVFDHIYVGMSSDGIVGIDLDTQTALWEIDIHAMNMTAGYQFDEFENHLYFQAVWDLRGPNRTNKFIKLEPHTGNYETVYQTQNGVLNPPAFHVSEEFGVRIIFNEYPFSNGAPPPENVQNIICIDYETGEEIWRNDSITEFYRSNMLYNAVIYDNRIVITGGDWSIYAFDVLTGEQLWRYEFDYPWAVWTKTNHIIHKDRLYVNNSQFDLTCLNPETGELIWNNTDSPNCTRNMVYYEKEDFLVFTSWGYGSVLIVDALTGKTIHRERKYENSQYNNDVVYDAERDMFFTSSYKHAFGFRVHAPD